MTSNVRLSGREWTAGRKGVAGVLFTLPGWLVVAGLASVALLVYANGLGKRSFSIDELYHVYAASSLNEHGTLSLPSGRLYERALPYTYLVGLFFRGLGVSELSARLPSAICGLLYACFFYYLVARAFGRSVAIVSMILLIFSPLEIYYSRESRMYSLLQLTYLLAAYAFVRALPVGMAWNRDKSAGEEARDARYRIFWALLCLAALGLSLYLHRVSTLFVVAAAFFAVLVFIDRLLRKQGWAPSAVVLVMVGLFIALATVLDSSIGVLNRLVDAVTYVPPWAQDNAGDFIFYFRVLYHQSFLLWLLIPIGALIALRKDRESTLLFASLFGVPFMIGSFLPLKQDRFLYHVYPFAIVFMAVALVFILHRLNDFMRREAIAGRKALSAGILALTVCVMALNVGYSVSRPKMSFPPTPDWRQAAAALRQKIHSTDLVVTDNPIAVRYYLGRVDYVVDANLLDISEKAGLIDARGRWRDYHTDAEHITSLSDMMGVVSKGKRVWILLGHDGARFETLRRGIRAMGTPVNDVVLDKRILVYRIGT